MKIILDTNLFVAAMFNKKCASAKIIQAVQDGHIQLIWSNPIKNETCMMVQRIAKAAGRSFDVNLLFKDSSKVTQLPSISRVSRDPDDDKFLACALAGNAEIIVSNDDDLLTLKSFQNIPIQKPSEAWRYIERHSREP